MGLLRRPTTSKIVEDGRLSRPCRPGAHSRASENPACGYATISASWETHSAPKAPVANAGRPARQKQLPPWARLINQPEVRLLLSAASSAFASRVEANVQRLRPPSP